MIRWLLSAGTDSWQPEPCLLYKVVQVLLCTWDKRFSDFQSGQYCNCLSSIFKKLLLSLSNFKKYWCLDPSANQSYSACGPMSIFVLGFGWGCGNKGEYLLPPTLYQLCQNRSGTGFKQGDLCFIIVDYHSVHREGAKWTRAQKRTECWRLGEGTATRKTWWLWGDGERQSNRWQKRDGRSKEPCSLGFQKEKSLQRYCNWVDDRGAVSMEHPTTGSLWQQSIPFTLFMKTKQGFTSMESLRMTLTDKPNSQCTSEVSQGQGGLPCWQASHWEKGTHKTGF